MSQTWKLLTLLLALLISACGSTPQSDYYILSTLPDDTGGNTGPFIGVGPITVPQYLDRKGIVTREDSNHLKISSFHRWAEPLPDGVQRVVAVNLAGLLDTEQVTTFPWLRSTPPEYGVEMNVVELSAEGRNTRLVVKWVLRDLADNAVIEQRISNYTRQAGGAEPGDIAAAYSDLLAQLSRDIAARISEAEANKQEG